MTIPLESGPVDPEVGPIGRLPRERLVEAARLVREGRAYSLADRKSTRLNSSHS